MTQEGNLIRLGLFNNDYYTKFSFKNYEFEIKYIDPEFSLRINQLLFTDLYFIYLKKNTLDSKKFLEFQKINERKKSL
jgi:hypothetical protein